MARAASTPKEIDDALTASYASLGAKALASGLGLTAAAVRQRAYVLGLKLHRKNATHVKLGHAQRMEAVQLYRAGLSAPKIAAMFDVKPDCVYAVLVEAGVNRHRTGSLNKRITDAEIALAEAAYLRGSSTTTIGKQLGYSSSAINAMLHRQGVELRKPGYRHADEASRTYRDKSGRTFVMRSTWEVRVARWLDDQDVSWSYEVETYKLVRPDGRQSTYTPDFWIYRGETASLIVDVKGILADDQAERIKLFREQYPELPFEVWNLYVLRKKGIFDLNEGGRMARAASTDL